MATLAELKARQRQKAGDILASARAQDRVSTGTVLLHANGTEPLVLWAVVELGAVCTNGYFEAQAEVLLACCDGSAAWARQWAALAEAAGWPCHGTTWREWAGCIKR